ncbi:MAG: UDP-glucose 4-epimerase GalE [Chloroflexota bacterium]
MRLLVTGGAGYIGSHTVQELTRLGHQVVVFDNLLLGHQRALPPRTPLIRGELVDRRTIQEAVAAGPALVGGQFDGVVHFAAYAVVGESMADPSRYFYNNVAGSINLLDAMVGAGVTRIVFSSSSEVYGEAQRLPIAEDHPKEPANPYGDSKWMVEQILARYDHAYGLRSTSLRYFNAAGAAEDGSIGEDHRPESHLIPNAILGSLGVKPFRFTCSPVATPDGTTIRDYIHVLDLASAHVLALQALADGSPTTAYNVALGHGYSTKEVVEAVQTITGVRFPTQQGELRLGEPAAKYAANDKIRSELGWVPKHDLESIIGTAWRWHRDHPAGYDDLTTVDTIPPQLV